MSKEFRVSDLFSELGERPRARTKTISSEEYLNKLSYRNKDWSPTKVQNVTNTFSKIVKNEDFKEIKLVDNNDRISTSFPIQANNRCQYFYNVRDGKKVDYKEVIKCEEISPSEYGCDTTCNLKKLGFKNFYQLYVKSEFNPNLDVKLCIMAIR